MASSIITRTYSYFHIWCHELQLLMRELRVPPKITSKLISRDGRKKNAPKCKSKTWKKKQKNTRSFEYFSYSWPTDFARWSRRGVWKFKENSREILMWKHVERSAFPFYPRLLFIHRKHRFVQKIKSKGLARYTEEQFLCFGKNKQKQPSEEVNAKVNGDYSESQLPAWDHHNAITELHSSLRAALWTLLTFSKFLWKRLIYEDILPNLHSLLFPFKGLPISSEIWLTHAIEFRDGIKILVFVRLYAVPVSGLCVSRVEGLFPYWHWLVWNGMDRHECSYE